MIYVFYFKLKFDLIGFGLVVGFVNFLFEIFVGFGVFVVLGFMVIVFGKLVSEVVGLGIGLVFIVFL